jgi:8-amino-7-oxononanoate synthase
MNFNYLYKNYLSSLQEMYRYRYLSNNNMIKTDFLDFSSNDYLNLSCNIELINAAKLAADSLGVGTGGSRLLAGNNYLFSNFETKIADDKKTPSALIFNSGFQANSSILAALLNKSVLGAKPLVFFDRLNHFSLYQGVFLSAAEIIRYQHNNLNHLNDLLLKYKDCKRPKFIICETLYGMDGDVILLSEIVDLAAKYQAFLYLDEAHATGILGNLGYGLSTTIDMSNISYAVMGTFSKAIGSYGAYIACSLEIKDYLINNCPGFIYSTSLAPTVIASAFKGWELIKGLNKEIKALLERSAKLRVKIQELGFDTAKSSTHIIPIILKSEELTLKAYNFLRDKKIIVSAIRPPTVPANSSRLRIALTLKHSNEDIEKLLTFLKEL